MNDKREYFAAITADSNAYHDALIEKLNSYRRYIESSGKLSLWKKASQNYYGISSDGTKSAHTVTLGGDAGQLVKSKVNDFRNLIQHALILITSQRPAGEAKAINSDTESLHQATIASSLIEYYLSQVGYEANFVRIAETALVNDESFGIVNWDPNAGDPVRPEIDEEGQPTGKMMMTGDLRFQKVSPWHMAREVFLMSPDEMKWGIHSWRENRFDVAEKYPNQREAILEDNCRNIRTLGFDIDENESDMMEVHCLYHDITPTVKNGRLTIFTSEVILFDGEFPYPEFNIYRMSQNDVNDSPFGYSNNYDILAIEEITDSLHTLICTNQIGLGGNVIVGPKGAGIDYKRLSNALSFLEVDPAFHDKIHVLQLVRTAPELFQYLETLGRKKETLAGINSVVRGDPEGALRSNSGSALALVQAQSLQFNSGGQRSYYHLLSRSCTGMIKILQRYADSEKVIQITGKVKGQYLKEFRYTKDDLKQVSSVIFEMTNPIEKSIGGKQALADNLLNKNMIKNPRQYLTVARTGNLDAMTQDDEADEMNLIAENERIREGKPVEPLICENHKEHVKSMMSVVASPESKDDAQLVARALEHIQKHTDMWQQLSMTNPAILIATGQEVLPPPPPPPGMMPPGGPGAPPPQGPPPQGPPPPTGGPSQNMDRMMSPQTPAEQSSQNIKRPAMPKNPMTGDRAPMPGV